MTKEVIYYLIQMYLNIWEFLFHSVHQDLYRIIYENPRDYRHLIFPFITLNSAELLFKLFFHKSDHANTIFELYKAIISLCLRKISARIYIPLITCLNKMYTMLFVCFFLKMFDYINDLTGIFFIERF